MGKIRIRLIVGIMLFMASFISYALRVNFSIILIAMVVPKTDDSTAKPPPDYGPRYKWSQSEQGLLLSAYFYGYIVTSIPAGMLCERFGGRAVAGYTLIISSFLTILSPFATILNMWALWACRFLLGMLGGFAYPAFHYIISKWAPPDEKGKFVATLMGGTFGTVVTWPITGIIIDQCTSWQWGFYINGVFCLIVTIIWFVLVSDTPAKHPFITEEEVKYIEDSLGDTLTKKKSMPPFLSLITSLPFIALVILHYGNMWGLTFLITEAPKFMSEVLGFKLTKAGFLSSLPHLARIVCAFIFGGIADEIRRRGLLTVTFVRKIFCVTSHVLPGIFLFLLAYFGQNGYVCVAIITISLGFNGSAVVTNLQNAQDLAPNYAASLYGIMNFFGNTTGIFAPMIVAYFTRDHNTLKEWKYVFLIGAIIYVVPAFIFFIFGSGEIQKWNYADKDANKNEANEKNKA